MADLDYEASRCVFGNLPGQWKRKEDDMNPEDRLGLQSMPDELMKLAKDQFGPQFLQFEIWVGSVIDAAFDVGKAKALEEAADIVAKYSVARNAYESPWIVCEAAIRTMRNITP